MKFVATETQKIQSIFLLFLFELRVLHGKKITVTMSPVSDLRILSSCPLNTRKDTETETFRMVDQTFGMVEFIWTWIYRILWINALNKNLLGNK